MSDFDIGFGASLRLSDVIGLGVLTRVVDRDTVDDVLGKAGRRESRVWLLPARVVVYLVLALCLFTFDGYDEVVRKLTNGLRGLRILSGEWKVPSPSAISQARTRLGHEVMGRLFEAVCVPVATRSTVGAFFGSLRIMAIDDTVVDVQDTAANAAQFGYSGAGGAKQGAFPQVRIATLVECGTHATVWAEFDAVKTSERTLVNRMTVQFAPDMVVLADRGFSSYDLWTAATEDGAQLLWRISGTLDLPVLGYYPDGSFRSELLPAKMKAAVKAGRTSAEIEAHKVPVRVVEYMVKNRPDNETIRLITTILSVEDGQAQFVTYAHTRGATDHAIAHQTRHRSLASVGTYIRTDTAWDDNAATQLGL